MQEYHIVLSNEFGGSAKVDIGQVALRLSFGWQSNSAGGGVHSHMMWVRSNIQHGARLALFALLVQLVLTFGHSHGFAQAAPLVHSSQQQADSHKRSTAIGHVSVDKQFPAGPNREHPAEDNCAICAMVAMAGTVVFATPPLLELPQAVQLLYLTTDAEFTHLKSAGLAFQPRAPPAS